MFKIEKIFLWRRSRFFPAADGKGHAQKQVILGK